MYYQLTGIVQHEGRTLENGHYVAVTRCGNDWFKKDDTQVEIVHYWQFCQHDLLCNLYLIAYKVDCLFLGEAYDRTSVAMFPAMLS